MRPPLQRELQGFVPYAPATSIDSSGKVLTLSENLNAVAHGGVEDGFVYNTYQFAFDRVYGPDSLQVVVYAESAKDVVMNALQGYNASIIAYGQTGAGKTHTMTGALDGKLRGIIPRAVDDVFSHIVHDASAAQCQYLVRASYLQIYNEVISDLLKPQNTNLMIREDKRRGVYVDGLSEWVVRTPTDVYDLMTRGAEARMTGSTKLNEDSSRSHAIFMLVIEKSSPGDNILGMDVSGMMAHPAKQAKRRVQMGKLNLVDLAGSERVNLTGAKGQRLEESKKINQSLSALGNVIGALTDPKRKGIKAHIPYRDSKLTRILEDSLGGNCKTTFVAVISPAVESFSESLSTLKFANRAKRVKNAPRVNEDENQRTLLKKYERELRKLRAELQQRSKDLVDRRLLLQLEEARKREQADKIAAISALERQSAEIARQKAAIASLHKRIASMQGQMLVGGQGVENTPVFQTLLAREQNRIREVYEKRLSELESERRTVAEDKAATERLKGLLLKQRDVMVALTKRLGERDHEVLELQNKLQTSEKKLKETEDVLDKRTAQLISIRKKLASLTIKESDKVPSVYGSEISYMLASDDTSYPSSEQKWSGEADIEDGPLEVTEFTNKESPEGSVVDSEERLPGGEVKSNRSSPRKEPIRDSEDKNQEQSNWPNEREALKTILQLKVLRVLDDVDTTVDQLQDSSEDSTIKSKARRQLEHLKKLVSATITAMEVI